MWKFSMFYHKLFYFIGGNAKLLMISSQWRKWLMLVTRKKFRDVSNQFTDASEWDKENGQSVNGCGPASERLLTLLFCLLEFLLISRWLFWPNILAKHPLTPSNPHPHCLHKVFLDCCPQLIYKSRHFFMQTLLSQSWPPYLPLPFTYTSCQLF